ncbi:mucin-5AC isoform X11 [Antechinus flavipes]|uniref:mucin-5AC isoform X11 n=1 Tax=Antechinus flavipes TaxID=38775 RepID=UPI0022364A07|nr:mucin-5AC isoform X11 [Antechinus flavipes]
MGAGSWGQALPLWALLLLASSSRQQQQPGHDTPRVLYNLPGALQKQDSFSGSPLRVSMPVMTTISPIKTYSPSHNGQVCSTWGDFHYKTFDGDIFHFPGLCNYVFSSHCKSPYEDFNIQIRRSPGPNATTTVSRVTLKLEGTVLEMSPGAILVNGKPAQLPFSQAGILVEKSSTYVRVVAKLGLVFLWNQDDGLLLELDAKYANQTCGLCGDFNGVPTYNEFFSNNIRLTAAQYGNMQKMDGPTEQCQDPLPAAPHNCTDPFDICETVLLSAPFFACHALVDVDSYVEACRQDACRCDEGQRAACICGTVAEYSRQCAHAGGLPANWRGPKLCPKTCPWNMQYRECGSPCVDTCSNHEQSPLCEEHCVDGCFCPPGTVFDDISGQGCVPVNQCFCTYKGQPYAPGAFYSTECTNCTCSGGQWSCQDLPCPGTCSVTGGSHFSTFDEKHYTVHGDCNYVLVKPCDDKAFTVLTELRKCGLTDSETCLKSVSLSVGQTVIVIKSTGEVFVNRIYTQLPVSAGNATLFRPSSSFIIAQTNLGLQLTIQLSPIMQVFVRLEPSLQGLTCGLCGNFNNIQADDFRTMSGVVEGTAAAFVNTYKTQADCPNVKNHFEDPCTLSVENEKYAQHWCGLLTDPQGPFALCHAVVSPALYHRNCMFDTCNCEKSEDCLCAALSSYVQACAAQGVLLSGWRAGVCTKSMSCPKSLTYHYHITTCQPTCRSLSEPDVTCGIKFVPVDGCACQEGTFMDDTGKCVPLASCPCYYQGSALPNGESVHDNGAICTCTQGRLNCIGGQVPKPACTAPMVYFDCRNASAGATGAECQKSCHTLDMACYNSQCVSGCVCPDGLVSDGEGGCIHKDQCPCVHNEANYQPGETIQVECNTCTCKNRMWECTKEPCLGTCAVYGDGHYITFDGQRYSFSGNCEYTLVQDHCGKNSSGKGTFRVITENIPCGTTGTTCSKAIKIFLGSYELKLSEGKVEAMEKEGAKGEPPYSIRQMGIYLIVDTNAGLVLLWDKKTSIFIQLSQDFKGKVCGLCGNYDGNTVNDFTTRSLSVVGDVQEFGNSWKLSPTCPDAVPVRDPCTANPYRKAWAQKQCSIINSAVFAACHPHVEPTKYYEACVSDACACDTGGDCECFCTAVAAYAQACNEISVCVSWRTPSICPLFCDYYNPNGSCEWHYQPCGAPCMKTCHNPSGKCSHNVRGLEGCYPKCPPEAPIFDEDKMECVQSCAPCYIRGRYYPPGSPVPSDQNCHSCSCTEAGIKCTYDSKACVCTYEGRSFHPGEIIYHTTDGTGGCITATCSANGTIVGKVYDCDFTTPAPSTTFSFSHTTLGRHSTCQGHKVTSVPPVTSLATEHFTTPLPMTGPTVTVTKSETTECVKEVCTWSPWLDVSHPGTGANSGDFDTLENIRAEGYRVCSSPRGVECRAAEFPAVPWQELNQTVECSTTQGLICHNKDQASGKCENYQIRILCCTSQSCEPSTVRAPTTEPHSQSTVTPATSTSSPSTIPEPESHSTKTTVSPTTKEKETTESHSPSPKTLENSSHSPKVTSVEVRTVPVTNPCLQEVCEWTAWIDGSYPSPDINGGDFDTFKHLRSEGYKFCDVPTEVECRAKSFPNTPLEELEQNVTCSKTEGLVCLNKDQLPPICYNYEIRIKCCWKENVCGPKERTTSRTYTTQTPKSHGVTKITTEQKPTVKPTCQPQCSWTKWFDVDFPSSEPSGGDEETYNNIMARGEKICHKPEYITELECRSESHPGVSINETGQVVECNPDYGLICRNQDQKGKFKMCFNYEIRVLCCEPVNCPITTTTSPTTPTTTSVTTKPSPETTSHSVSTTTTSTPSSPQTPTTSVSTTPTTTPSTSTHPSTPSCQPQCSWTKWFDVDFPSSGPNGGDEETYNNIMARGEKICHKPEYITELECRSESHPEVSINETGQVVECNPDYGLICRNQDQKGKFKMCFNYEIRVLCCEPVNCPITTTTSPTTPITTSVTTKSSPETTSHSVPTTTTSTPSSPQTPTTSVSTTPTTTPSTSTHPSTPSCQPQCSWTKWFDVDFPSSGPNGGDEETYNNIMARGEKICHKPEYITELECRSESHPGVSINETGQVVECNPDYGLICRNQDQKGKFKMCFNYEIRVLCCEPVNCPITTTTSPTTPTTTSVTTKSSPETTSHSVPTTTTSTPSSPQTPTTSVSTTPTTTPSTSTHPSTPSCQPQCSWTKWFDVDFPSSGPNGGDEETYNNIMARGEKICHKPEYITELECRSESHPEVSINETGQVVECNPDYGLICRNQDQKGKFKMCFNYEIRVLCCEPVNCPITTTTSPTTPTTTSVTTKSSPETTSHSVPTTTTSTPSSPQTPTTSVSTTPTTTPSTSTHPPTPSCQPQCSWTKWFDVDFPSSGPNGGDEETYNNIMARGEKICHKPEYITELECRSESHPGVSINETGQVVECNPDYGLICRNQDQKGKFKMCFNYEIRVLCCEPVNCPITTTTSPTTPTTTSVTTKPSPETTSHSVPTTTTSTPSSPQTPMTSVSTPTEKIPSTTPTTTPSTSTYSPTPSCQPQCSWTKWFDVDFPSSGPNGGDEETYNNIMARGEKICHKPEHITELECRSESHPEVSINETGQVVECNPDYGLICRNQDQKGKFKICFNYEIRVLCCEPMDNCPSTMPSSSLSPTISMKTSATTFLPSSKIPPFHVSTTFSTLSPHSSSSCYCFLSGKVYPAGTVIYNQTDNAGYCYSAICNRDCSVERIAESCPTIAPAPSPSTSASTTTAIDTSATTPRLPSASSSRPPVTTGKSSGCLNAEPPRKKGETWFMHKCKKATCEGDDVITLTPVSCPPVKELSCANGYPPVKVYDDADHCCYHYECQCVCSGWGDPHYITFDGIYYTFLDNCTYVLVQQIHPVYDHFRVLIDNYFCDAQDGLSCPRSITVEYKDNRIVLIRTLVRGMMENEIIFNNRTVSAGFKKDGIVISTLGIKMFVTIPEIGVQVMFSGMLFSVEVPFTKFANNTEGQCGTCTNDKRDECRLPDGKMASSCSAMSGSWKYHVPGQPYCAGPPPTPPVPSPTTSKPCPPSLLCMLIMSEVFEACHHVIPPEPYFEGCVYDQCRVPDGLVWCSSLELYASLCAAEGVCIDWRGETQGQCALTCPAGQVYQACGPIYPPTCQSPQGSINSSLTLPGNIGVLTEGCFCPTGTTMFSFDSEVCVPATPSECHSWCTGPNGEPVKPGATVPSGLCETCSCVRDDNPESKKSVIHCQPIVCDTHCPMGFKYQEEPGRCCGKCVQVACVVHTNGSAVHLVKPGQTWSSPEDKCVQYECEKVNGQLILVTAKKACPPVLCSPDQVRKSEDGCCLVCPPPPQVYPCAVGRHTQVIRKGSCSSPTPVEVTYCQGNCGDTMSIYSFESNALEHRCRCCRELSTSQRNVTLTCPDGSSLAFAFSQVEECGCQRLRCDKPDGGSGEGEESGESEEEPARSQETGAAPAAQRPR